jgi:pSer/pThr/pTyr-binding forkhead associated (FHA) protein
VRVGDLAEELETLGRPAFEKRYGKHFLVFPDGDVIDDFAEFVNTASRVSSDVLAGRTGDAEVHPLAKPRITVGRRRDCDIPVAHKRVSSLHAVFLLGGGLLCVADARSKNGTQVNGHALVPDQPTPVDAGDIIQFGPVSATLWGLEDLLAASRR